MGGVFEFAKCASANLREKEDTYNSTIGGFLAGSVLGLRGEEKDAWEDIGSSLIRYCDQFALRQPLWDTVLPRQSRSAPSHLLAADLAGLPATKMSTKSAEKKRFARTGDGPWRKPSMNWEKGEVRVQSGTALWCLAK
jgi:hypothetical protein